MSQTNTDRETLRELLEYRPTTGEFIRQRAQGGMASDTIAGTLGPDGYVRLSVYKKKYLAHRLAWFVMTGAWPVNEVDHINGNRSDNRWENLRAATRAQQSMNSCKSRANSSGYKGVRWDKDRGKWLVRIKLNRISRNLGRFDDLSVAKDVYAKAARAAFGDFARVA